MDEEEPKEWIVTLLDAERDILMKDVLPSLALVDENQKNKSMCKDILF